MDDRSAQVEIERKFLADELPFDLSDLERVPMRQGYLVVDDARKLSVRIRQQGEDFRLTIKQGAGPVRTEVELPIGAGQFEALWPSAKSISLEKDRYLKRSDDCMFEIDVFAGALAPLVLVEIEFESEEASARFEPPPWLGREVTHDPAYLNQNLAQEGIPPQTP